MFSMIGLLTFFAFVTAAAVASEIQCTSERVENWGVQNLHPHEDCNKFYVCLHGQLIEQRCPASLYFDVKTKKCEWYDDVDCGDRKIPGEEKPEPVITEQPVWSQTSPKPGEVSFKSSESSESSKSSQSSESSESSVSDDNSSESEEGGIGSEIEFLPNGCPVNPQIYWKMPHECDCSLFYYCDWRKKVLHQCPASLHYNKVLQVCDWPSNAKCSLSANEHQGGREETIKN